MTDQLTPVQIEVKLRQLVTELTRAHQMLAVFRDEEVDKKHARDRALRMAILSADCPKVTRGGWTTAERDAWVEEQIDAEHVAYDLAESARKAAEDHLRVVRDQASIVQSLGASVRQAYGMAGVA